HDEDLMMVLAPLREVLARYRGRVTLELVGVAQGHDVAKQFQGLPLSFQDPRDASFYPLFHEWMRKTLQWDIAIAPLVDNAFTRCKSDIKYLDYGALGVPGVFSDSAAYRDTVKHGETGFLAGDARSWRDGLVELIENRPLREAMGRRANHELMATRTLTRAAPSWVEALCGLGPRSAPPGSENLDGGRFGPVRRNALA
ncbi:MAG: glycosyltransferase, partial [Thermoanaerobaculia bacterium]